MKGNLPGPIHAFAFNNGTLNGDNIYVGPLASLRQSAPERDKGKYDRTIAFIQKHSRGGSSHAA